MSTAPESFGRMLITGERLLRPTCRSHADRHCLNHSALGARSSSGELGADSCDSRSSVDGQTLVAEWALTKGVVWFALTYDEDSQIVLFARWWELPVESAP